MDESCWVKKLCRRRLRCWNHSDVTNSKGNLKGSMYPLGTQMRDLSWPGGGGVGEVRKAVWMTQHRGRVSTQCIDHPISHWLYRYSCDST